eukprot:jgi/Bigna1/127934/aug1.5_g2642
MVSMSFLSDGVPSVDCRIDAFPPTTALQLYIRTSKIKNFIDENCIVFDEEEENKLAFTEVHNKFCALVEATLSSHLSEIGVTDEQFATAISENVNKPQAAKLLREICAAEDYLLFKTIMVKRNRELTMQAISALKDMQTEIQRVANTDATTSEVKAQLASTLQQQQQQQQPQGQMTNEEELILSADIQTVTTIQESSTYSVVDLRIGNRGLVTGGYSGAGEVGKGTDDDDDDAYNKADLEQAIALSLALEKLRASSAAAAVVVAPKETKTATPTTTTASTITSKAAAKAAAATKENDAKSEVASVQARAAVEKEKNPAKALSTSDLNNTAAKDAKPRHNVSIPVTKGDKDVVYIDLDDSRNNGAKVHSKRKGGSKLAKITSQKLPTIAAPKYQRTRKKALEVFEKNASIVKKERADFDAALAKAAKESKEDLAKRKEFIRKQRLRIIEKEKARRREEAAKFLEEARALLPTEDDEEKKVLNKAAQDLQKRRSDRNSTESVISPPSEEFKSRKKHTFVKLKSHGIIDTSETMF